jgi:hypothetical protein
MIYCFCLPENPVLEKKDGLNEVVFDMFSEQAHGVYMGKAKELRS